jgi:hypothetical protein
MMVSLFSIFFDFGASFPHKASVQTSISWEILVRTTWANSKMTLGSFLMTLGRRSLPKKRFLPVDDKLDK